MKRNWLQVCVFAALWPVGAWAGDVKLAERVPFTVPLGDGQKGTGILLDAGQLLVAAPGNPPRLGFYAISEKDMPVPPSPRPGPGPGPGPTPPPGPSGPLSLLWIEETQARTPGQARALTDASIRETLAAAGWPLRVVDQDITDETGKTPPDLAPAIAQAKNAGLPYLIAMGQGGAEVFAGKAPEDEKAFAELLRRLGLPLAGPSNNDTGQKNPGEAKQAPEPEEEGAPTAAPCPTGRCPAQPTTRFFLFRRR